MRLWQLAWGHTSVQWQRWGLNLGGLVPTSRLFAVTRFR